MIDVIYFILLLSLTVISCYRIIKGPTNFDRIISMNVTAVLISVMFIVYSVQTDMAHFLDIAFVFIVLNFVATLGFAKYLERGEFS